MEIFMVKKWFFAGMLVMALVFGMTVVGCDNGSTDENGNGNGNDAVTWTDVTDSTFGSSTIWDFTYGAGKFVAVGDEGKMAYSLDGITWTAVANSPFSANNYHIAIAYGDGKFVAMGRTSNDLHKVAYSTDGIVWTEAVGNNAFSGTFYDIAYGAGKFVAVGHDMAYSADGQTWMAASTNDFPPYLTILGIAYNNGRFVAGGNSGSGKGKIVYSDGETWVPVTDITIDTNDVIEDIAYGGGKFVAVSDGNNAKITYSIDGLNWMVAAEKRFLGVAYGGGKFVAVGFGSAYSVDGIIWMNIASSIGGYRTEAIAYGGSAGSRRFVVGTGNGRILYSNVQE
jgi:hypothetical protein